MSRWMQISLWFAVCAASAFGQEVSAGITGRVTDPSGAAIANASVNAKDVQRGTEWPTKTNEEGVFAFPRVPIGTYDLRIEAPGFKTAVRAGITLDVNQRARIDVAMEIGGVAETVNVASDAVLLQTEKTQVGSVIGPQTIVNTPLVSRNPIALTLLAPGVIATDPSSFNNGQRTTGGGRPYVNGNRKEANNFLLDGIDNNQTSDNLSSYQPNLDAIQEFNMITNNASAEFGNFQGGIINVIIKSGTNQFHGSLFEYFRNDKLNANNWARNWSAQPRPALRWNQFGGTVGGPIFKDKLFFFADYQALRKTSPPTISGTTLMPAEWRRGDFSRLLEPAYSGVASGIQLYNPFQLDANGNRAPFPNNQIPLSLFSPVVQKIFGDQSLYPLPQVANVARLGVEPNYFYSTASQLKSDQGDFKLDWKVTNKDDFSGRYSNGRQDTPGITTLPFQYNSFNIAPFQNGVVNWTRTINPTLVNEARLGVNNIMLNNGGEDRGLGDVAQKLGIQNAGAGLLSLGSFAYTAGLGNANIGTQQLFANTTYHLADNLTIIRGRHMMKTGGQILRQQMNTFYAGNNGRTGFINFNGRFTQGPNAKSPTTKAVGEADFILGLPSGLGRGLSTGTWGHRKTIYGFYFQDDWRATNKLTLNLGLRWEYHTPLVEVKDRQSNFEPFTGKLLLAGRDGNSRALYAPFKKDFQPRVGFAYTVSNRMVVRGAYTISSFMEGTGTNLRLPLNPPFNSEFEARYDSPDFLLPGSTLQQGLSALNPKDPYLGANIRLWDPFVRPANAQQWNLTTEFQLPAAQVFSLAYVGQHGTHLIVPMPYFQRHLLPNGTVVPSPYLAGNTALRSAITQISGTEADGNQKYNSLQASLRKRFSKGLEYQVSYTWSKGMSDAIGYYGEGGQAGSQSAYWQNLYDRKAEWGPTYFDTTHNFVASFVYELPVGRKRTYGTDMNSLADAILGGWQLGGIFSAHTGFPLTIQSSSDTSGTLSRGARANVVKTPNDPHQIGPNAKWFDTTAFAIPPAGTFGNVGVGTERGPGMKRLDLTLGKRFRVFETRYVELRGEAFNLTNTPIFSGPTRSVQSSTFGEIRGAQGDRNVQLAARFVF